MRALIEQIARAPADRFDLNAALVALLNYAAEVARARSAYLKRTASDPGRAIIACSGVGGVIALDGTVTSYTVPVFDEGVQVAVLVLLRDAGALPLAPEDVGTLELLADITGLALRRSVMDDEIRRNQHALREAIEAKYQLLGGVSLNLKNSLNVAAGYLELIGMPTEFPEERVEFAGKSRKAIETAVELINELVELARAEAGEVPIELDMVSPGSFVRDAITNHSATITAKRILVNTDISTRLPAVYTDPTQVREILDALMNNALKYTPDAGVISVRAELKEGRRLSDPAAWVCLAVQDSGPGLQDVDTIFEEVPRVDRLRNKRVGFRLVICRRVARLLGGDLTAESTPNRGSTFTLWLPVARRA